VLRIVRRDEEVQLVFTLLFFVLLKRNFRTGRSARIGMPDCVSISEIE
jgi:hypothetical protein